MLQKHGTVTSAKMRGTVTVTVHHLRAHPIYRKRYRISTKFLADTNGLDLGEGDKVVITECRPISKRKRFKVTEIITHAPRVGEVTEEEGLEEAMHPVSSHP